MVSTNNQPIEQRLSYLINAFEELADSEKSAQFQRYLKTQQPMFGVNAGPRIEELERALKLHPVNDIEDYCDFVALLWRQPHRELQYCAIDTALKYKKFHTMEAWPLFEQLALSAKWWDLTDGIAVNLVGSLLLKNRSLQTILDTWMYDQDLWIRRTSLLAHLKHKKQTDTSNLERTILTLTVDKQFFLQKAIGWSLREYSKTNPSWVLTFLDEHSDKLSNLALREGTKFLNKP